MPMTSSSVTNAAACKKRRRE
uniref:Uncharacterized protein n=1 Tax=Arundo donax TaxID=35708 RepID=A0A0A9D2Q9_ARUDO